MTTEQNPSARFRPFDRVSTGSTYQLRTAQAQPGGSGTELAALTGTDRQKAICQVGERVLAEPPKPKPEQERK